MSQLRHTIATSTASLPGRGAQVPARGTSGPTAAVLLRTGVPKLRRAVTIALGDTHELVTMGLGQMLAPYESRVRVLGRASHPQGTQADLVLVDPCVGRTDQASAANVIASITLGRRLVIYTCAPSTGPGGLERLRAAGWPIRGWLSKTLPADDLVGALERIQAGHLVVLDQAPSPGGTLQAVPPPRSTSGQMSDRENLVVAMIGQGMSNQAIADVTFLSINTVKTYIRSSYRKMGVTSRTQAVLWSVSHGLDIVPWEIVHGIPRLSAAEHTVKASQ